MFDVEEFAVAEQDALLIYEAEIAPVRVKKQRLPHPIPYQGSKRNLAPQILAVVQGRHFRRFYEPFAGSAALTIAARTTLNAQEYVIGDILSPLINIWQQIVASPLDISNTYEQIWYQQLESDDSYYNRIRDEFNTSHDPAKLLYLLARCVKNAPRFNLQGEFNQSHDRRRLGMHPQKMRGEILGASTLLAQHTSAVWGDFEDIIADATEEDIVYMDPPYEGTSTGGDKRYYRGLDRERLVQALVRLNQRGVPFLLSYDGRCGDKTYGEPLPDYLDLTHLELHAGRSSQATLNGESHMTIESLYVSNNLFTR